MIYPRMLLSCCHIHVSLGGEADGEPVVLRQDSSDLLRVPHTTPGFHQIRDALI